MWNPSCGATHKHEEREMKGLRVKRIDAMLFTFTICRQEYCALSYMWSRCVRAARNKSIVYADKAVRTRNAECIAQTIRSLLVDVLETFHRLRRSNTISNGMATAEESRTGQVLFVTEFRLSVLIAYPSSLCSRNQT